MPSTSVKFAFNGLHVIAIIVMALVMAALLAVGALVFCGPSSGAPAALKPADIIGQVIPIAGYKCLVTSRHARPTPGIETFAVVYQVIILGPTGGAPFTAPPVADISAPLVEHAWVATLPEAPGKSLK